MSESRPPDGAVGIVDVIIPVFRDFAATRACIDSVLASGNTTPLHLIVVDDASPDEALTEWMRGQAAEARFELIVHRENRGFVASVNEGMRLHPERDVVLLNSDTIVANNWLDRMIEHLRADARVGTLTPFSNNATICSFPIPNSENSLPEGWNVASLDRCFARRNHRRSLELPTGVGFCLLIRRACLDDVGLFDEERFGRGYGEENDFCLRAESQGWRNLLCGDVFVYHAGGSSFGEERAGLQDAALQTVQALHPGYTERIRDFVRDDPVAPLRWNVAAAVLFESLEETIRSGPGVLHVLGLGGGGSERHVRDLDRQYRAAGDVQHLVLFLGRKTAVILDLRTRLYYPFAASDLLTHWAAALEVLRVRTVHWHAINPEVLALAECKGAEGVRAVVTLHDIGFLNPHAFRGDEEDFERLDDGSWRDRVLAFLLRMSAVLAPSQFIAEECSRVTEGQVPVRVCPHAVMAHYRSAARHSGADLVHRCRAAGFSGRDPTIALVGALGEHKGIGHWRQTYQLALERDSAINWVLVGYADPELTPSAQKRLVVHGAFLTGELRALLGAYEVDLVYFPPGMPESFSYALSDVWSAGWPVVVHDRGALGERLRAFPAGGWLLPSSATPSETLDALLGIVADPEVLAGAQGAVSRSAGADHGVREGCRYEEDVWMVNEPEYVPESGRLLELQPLLATHLDDELFRRELIRVGGEKEALEKRLAAAEDSILSLRDLADQRAQWAVKLETDISGLRQAVQSLFEEKETLSGEIGRLRENPCIRLSGWLRRQWARIRK